MAYEIPGFTFTLPAAADLSAKQFYAVTVDSTGKVAVAGVGTQIAGVLQNKPASGMAATIMALGITKMVASAAITAGSMVGVTAAGKAKTLTLGAGTGTSMVGIALSAAAADLDVITVLLLPAGAQPTTPA